MHKLGQMVKLDISMDSSGVPRPTTGVCIGISVVPDIY